MGSLFASLFRWWHGQTLRALETIPGPTPTFPLGTMLDFVGRQPWELCAQYGQTYGPTTLIWLMGKPALVLNDPKLIGEILETRTEDFYKAAPCAALLPVITDACPFIANGAAWAFKRANHPLVLASDQGWLNAQVAPLRDYLQLALARQFSMASHGDLPLLETIQRLVFDTFAVAVWGQTLDDKAYNWFNTPGRMGDFRMKLEMALPLWPPLSPWFWYHRYRWYGLFEQLVAAARARNSKSDATSAVDLLAWALRQGSTLSNVDFRNALVNVFYGGVYSVTSGIVTALYLLAQNPAEAARLDAALMTLVTDSPALDAAALEQCAPLDEVLREALRFYPPVPIYFRNTCMDRSIAFAGATLPPNTMIFISNWWLQKSAPHWGDPERFRPARWADGGAAANPLGSRYFFPFGRGPRACLGQDFGWMCMKLVLTLLRTRARVELAPGQPYRQRFFFGVMMPQKLRAGFFPRADS